MTIQSDCRLYSGYKPCGKQDDCIACPHYAPWAGQILVVKLAAAGDVVRTTTILPGLRKHLSDHCITWLTDPGVIPLLKHNPMIDRLFPFNADGLAAVQAANYTLLLNFEKETRALGFCRAVTAYKKKGFAASRSGTPMAADEDSEYALRLGLSDDLKFRANTLTYPQIIYEMAGLPYEGQEYVLELGPESIAECSRRRKEADESCDSDKSVGLLTSAATRVIGINTGCGTVFATKRWTVDGFVGLVEGLSALPNVHVLLLGGPLEVEFNREILERARGKITDTRCDNTLEQFLGIIECCDMVVSADSLAMHLAIGRKKQVVALFGPTCHQEVDLFGRGEKVVTDFPCAPCYLTRCEKSPSCMDAMSASSVAAAVKKCLERIPA